MLQKSDMKDSFEHTYFELLRSALWSNAPRCTRILTEEEWNATYKVSKEQTVCGIILDAIAQLPEEQKPGTRLRLQWIMLLKAIEAQNKKMNNALTCLVKEMNEHSITPYLLKGQGVASNYNIPGHRICGDIDIYFAPEQFEQAIKFFSSKGFELEGDPNVDHCETTFMGFKVEIHKKCATFYTKKLQKRFNEIINDIIKNENSNVVIEDCKIAVLPPMANALQLLSHMLRHIIFSGLGLRQVCDWALFMHRHQKDIDKELFIRYAKELQLWNTYKAVTAICIDYLGLPKEYAICNISDKDRKLANKVLCLIMTYGNFGQYGEHCVTRTKTEYLRAYLWKVKNCIRFHRLAKSETWNYPIWQLHSAVKIITKK